MQVQNPTPPYYTASKSLIFLHVPKCGGATINSILQKNFPKQRRFCVDGSSVVSSREKLAKLSMERRRRIDLLDGHLSYGWHELLPREAVYFTLLRNPVARVVSHYNYVRFRSDRNHYLREAVERANMTIGDYVRSGVCDEMNNGQVRLLAGIEDIVQAPYGESRIPYGSNNTALLKRALTNVRKDFVFVGLVEKFDESMLLLKERLGFKNIFYTSGNVSQNHYKKLLPTSKEVEIIKEYNALDIRLYNLMQKRLEEVLLGDQLSTLRLRVFRLQNSLSALPRNLYSRVRSAILV